MNPKLSHIKDQVDTLKKAHGNRAKIPSSLWEDIYNCSKSMPLQEICQSIGIDHGNARSKFKTFNQKYRPMKTAAAPLGLVQLPSSPTPLMEMALANGTLIRVFSA